MSDWTRELRGKEVIATWSGGIDSTAVVCELVSRGFNVIAVPFLFGQQAMIDREEDARLEMFEHIKKAGPGDFRVCGLDVREFMAMVSMGGAGFIPNRNKRFLDLLVARFAMPIGVRDLAMGEYVGADTWLVKDHVGAHDADARYLEAYLLAEYGHEYRMWTLRDFGLPQRYKCDRLRIVARHMDPSLTTNCLLAGPLHCGRCYKCVERAVAFHLARIADGTEYEANPRQQKAWPLYVQQQSGEPVDLAWETFGMEAP